MNETIDLIYLDTLSIHGILAGHTIPTREGSCLDHFMLKLDKSRVVAKIFVLNTTVTDHAMIFLCLTNINRVLKCNKTRQVTDFASALESLMLKNISELLFCEDPNWVLNILTHKINESLLENTKTIKIPKNQRVIKPWITVGILRCIKNRNKMQKSLKSDPHNNILGITYLRYRNFCNKLIKKLKRKYERRQLALSTKDSKKLWSSTKQITNMNKAKENHSKLLNIKTCPTQSVNYINHFFGNVGKSLAEDILNKNQISENPEVAQSSHNPTLQSFVLLETDPEEVHDTINSLKSTSASGWDEIPTRFLKIANALLVPIICHLANLSFAKGVFPSLLKKSIITPVYKSGDKNDINNYRPISVLTSISKILEKLINKRLLNFLEKFKTLSDCQFGFRKGKSTEDAVVALSSFISEQLDDGKKCLTVFLDLKKAFDTVSIPILLNKLENIGIRGTPLSLFRDYLFKRQQCVKINQYTSEDIEIDYGVPQGSVLGPSLFLVYINDLCNMKLFNARVFSYADDTAVTFPGLTWQNVQQDTEAGLTKISNWLNSNLLTLNTLKTNFVCFTMTSRTQPASDFNIKIHKCDPLSNSACRCPEINKVTAIKYLGVMLDERLSWDKHIDLVNNRIRKLIWIFKTLRHVAPKPLLSKIYISLVQSIIIYCIPVWGGARKTKFLEAERAQRLCFSSHEDIQLTLSMLHGSSLLLESYLFCK